MKIKLSYSFLFFKKISKFKLDFRTAECRWQRANGDKNEREVDKKPNESPLETRSSDEHSGQEGDPFPEGKKKKGKPGKQPGAKGFGRTQKLVVTHEVIHRPESCRGCGCDLGTNLPFHGKGGYYTLDLKLPKSGHIGLHGTHTKHLFGSVKCLCEFENRTSPKRLPGESGWIVELGEWRLIGPRLLAFLVFLKLRLHATISKTAELLSVWFGISLSDGCINTALREAGRAASYLEPEILEALKASNLLYVDETSWKEHKVKRWFWVGVGNHVVYYTIGPRSSETALRILEGFKGWLMTDGYMAYRQFSKRIRCWAHLERKAKGLEESWDKEAANFGAYAASALQSLRENVYQMRGLPLDTVHLEQKQCDQTRIEFIFECLRRDQSEHQATRAFAVEILNDHEAVFQVLQHPELPLTNNSAERALRCWVILRKVCHGSKTEEGSRVLSILASVTDTLRIRQCAVWTFLADIIAKRRSCCSPPSLPPIPTPTS